MLGKIDGMRIRGNRGWDGWMASAIQQMWVWVNSRRRWWTGRPGMLWFMGLQRVGHDWVTELNWTEHIHGGFPDGSGVKNLPAVQVTQIQFLSWKESLNKEMAKIKLQSFFKWQFHHVLSQWQPAVFKPWKEKKNCAYNFFFMNIWENIHLTLAWKIPQWRSLVGCSPLGHEESDTTERLHFHFSLSCIGEGNGNPLQSSCLENPRDRRAWWAAFYGVAQSWTRLKWSSSSNYK